MSLLLEVVIGLGIFSISLLVALGVISMSGQATSTARNHSAALSLARGTLDSELSKTFAAIGGGSEAIVILGERSGIASSTEFTIRITVTPDGTEKKHVKVAVAWPAGNLTRDVSVEGYATRR
jgi:type II secretory pathway pseudopilin PulG